MSARPFSVWSHLLRRPVSAAGLAVVALLVVLAFLGPQLAPYGPNAVDVTRALQPPSLEHWFGTDDLGRDVLSRVVLAARVSLQVSLISVSIALVAGVVLGLLAGYFRGWADTVIMRVVDVVFAFPIMLLAIAIVAVLGPGVTTATIAIGVVYVPVFARVTRASTLALREEPYVKAAAGIGAGPLRIIRTHVLPNVSAPVIVQTSLSLAFAILSEAALSFLGLGVQPPQPSWGRMLFDGKGFTDAWWMSVFPGLAIFVTVLAFNLVGDGLRDVLDPRRRSAMESGRGR
ncbi:ABC transporter permease [Streptomyces marispadix]|uniref:ABC transporter permease n=1 Tax=Streptomyces marispadix TaxID=2922868 RepID=A0ABS9T5X5_9ACTN|nr:ABC transporter permease [Streptomyces marispadix]MCH6163858.1 ABC transporter permease [Streptomyces marispadix]